MATAGARSSARGLGCGSLQAVGEFLIGRRGGHGLFPEISPAARQLWVLGTASEWPWQSRPAGQYSPWPRGSSGQTAVTRVPGPRGGGNGMLRHGDAMAGHLARDSAGLVALAPPVASPHRMPESVARITAPPKAVAAPLEHHPDRRVRCRLRRQRVP